MHGQHSSPRGNHPLPSKDSNGILLQLQYHVHSEVSLILFCLCHRNKGPRSSSSKTQKGRGSVQVVQVAAIELDVNDFVVSQAWPYMDNSYFGDSSVYSLFTSPLMGHLDRLLKCNFSTGSMQCTWSFAMPLSMYCYIAPGTTDKPKEGSPTTYFHRPSIQQEAGLEAPLMTIVSVFPTPSSLAPILGELWNRKEVEADCAEGGFKVKTSFDFFTETGWHIRI